MAVARGFKRPVEREQLGSPENPRSWESLISAYLEWRAVHHFAASARKSIESNLRMFGSFCCQRGLESPVEVAREVIERYQGYLFRLRTTNDRPLSVRTQVTKLTNIKSFFRWLAKERYLEHDPSALLELPKLSFRLPVDVFSQEEVEEILAVPDLSAPLGLRNRAILEVFYSTGIRRGELAALQVYDVDFTHGILTVRQGKGGKDRVVPIGERALFWLGRYLEEARPELLIRSGETTLFLSETGASFGPEALGALVGRIIEQSGVRERVGACHLFRHTMATQMLSNGADIRFIQEMLGHVSLETTQIYTRVSIEKLKAVHTATHPAAQLRSSGPGDPVLPAAAFQGKRH
jgi:integrase/recombinase XerD